MHEHYLYIPFGVIAVTVRKWKLKKKNEQAGTFTDCMGLLLWIYWPYLQECHSSTMWSLVVKQKRWVFFCSIQKQQWWLTVRKLPCPMKLSSPHFLQLHNAVARKWFWDVKWNLCQKKKKWFFNVFITSLLIGSPFSIPMM